MHKRDQQGFINVFIILFAITLVGFVVGTGFGVWAFMQRQQYKNDAEEMVAAAVAQAEERVAAEEVKKSEEREKSPSRPFMGPDTFGALTFMYPKNWSGLVNQAGSGDVVDGYFYPTIIPGIKAENFYALRVQIVSNSYDQEVKKLDEAKIKSGKLRITPYRPAKVPSVLGIRVDGEVNPNKKGTGAMVMMPVRDKTIKIYTENDTYLKDFNETIVPSIVFNP